ncbi:MAG: hypothetical protein J3R72DRAFT_498895 [Linnemannia gamsii]|nr:MAG: hypothetical protein J3R72DRAFT_498895 [Linnemannia gamsii]
MKAVFPIGIGLVSAAYLVMKVLSDSFCTEKPISIVSLRLGQSTRDKELEEDQDAFVERCESEETKRIKEIHEAIRDNVTSNLPGYTARIVFHLEENLHNEIASMGCKADTALLWLVRGVDDMFVECVVVGPAMPDSVAVVASIAVMDSVAAAGIVAGTSNPNPGCSFIAQKAVASLLTPETTSLFDDP